MRLTLRTLLAYLDNTLDPDDASALRDKLSESGFATTLVQRIRQSLVNGELSAPTPDSVGPVEDANVISEYLDSTLTPEQVAEIERACLESDTHLAEAAACHQILTLILGKSAEVSPELRQRIYELPEKNIESIATPSGSFSAVSIPESPDLGPSQDDILTADANAAEPPSDVKPVGIADSGVSDAPTRLREAGVVDDALSNAGTGPAIAGTKPRATDETSLYGGTVRTSRITPWLVTLALTAVTLFALARIFYPLLDNGKLAEADGDLSPIVENNQQADGEPESDQTNGATDQTNANPEEIGTSEGAEVIPAPAVDEGQEPVEQADVLPAAVDNENDENSGEASVDIEEAMIDVDDLAPPVPGGDALPMPAPDKDTGESIPVAVDPNPNGAPASVEVSEEVKPIGEMELIPLDKLDSASNDAPPVPPTVGEAGAPVPPPPVDDPNGQEAPVDPDDLAKPPAVEIAKLGDGPTLIVTGQSGGNWTRLKPGAAIGDGTPLVVAPTFRATFQASNNTEITSVGASRLVLKDDGGQLTVDVQFGRVLIKANEPGVNMTVILGGHPVKFQFKDAGATAAASVKFSRPPGLDPLVVKNRTRFMAALAVQGPLTITSESKEHELATGVQWIRKGDSSEETSPVDSILPWIDPPASGVVSIESSARDGLLAVLQGAPSLELALTEATSFRRSEVAALAARTLLLMGRADIYFGGDGIMNQPKQRLYWGSHFQSLLDAIDLNSVSAESINRAIVNLDSAHARDLQRMLVGYSQQQLKAGGDKELVAYLDSSSMAVRAFALENLQRITGTTLYFRADQDNPVRREPGIEKWKIRQRKGDIRWKE